MPSSLSPAEIASLRPPERLPISRWVERHRILTEGHAAEPGPKSLARTPFLAPLYDWWTDPYVREIVVQKSAQIGLTDLAVDLVGFTAANDPCPMAVFLADQLTAEKVMVDRIQPMLRGTEILRPLVDENRLTKTESYLRNGYNLTVSWASSIAQTASRPFKHLILDEINKPGYSATGDEGSAIGRLRQRQETFSDSKALLLSTPTIESGNVTSELATCDVVYEWEVPCPACGAYQPMRFSVTKMPDGSDSGCVVWEGGSNATTEQIEATARYQCGACKALWTTAQKNEAVARGRAAPRSPAPLRPRKIGYQISRLISLFPGGRLEKLVLDWCASQKDPRDLQNFVNSALAEPWVERIGNVQEREALVLAARLDIPPRECPPETVAVVAGIDTQQRGFWYRIRAYAKDMTSWGIDEGYLPGWEELESLIFDAQFPISGRPGFFKVWRAGIDTGGTKHEDDAMSRTEEVYLWVQRNMKRGPRLFPCKGSSSPLQAMIALGKDLIKTPSGKSLAGSGMQLLMIDTDQGKRGLWHRIEAARDHQPGAAYLHRDTSQEYVRQILAEEQRRKRDGSVEWHRIRPANHLLDCEVICRALVDSALYGGLFHLKPPAPDAPPPAPAQPKPQQPPQRRENPWTRGTSIGGR